MVLWTFSHSERLTPTDLTECPASSPAFPYFWAIFYTFIFFPFSINTLFLWTKLKSLSCSLACLPVLLGYFLHFYLSFFIWIKVKSLSRPPAFPYFWAIFYIMVYFFPHHDYSFYLTKTNLWYVQVWFGEDVDKGWWWSANCSSLWDIHLLSSHLLWFLFMEPTWLEPGVGAKSQIFLTDI